jgi:hypothetical protein
MNKKMSARGGSASGGKKKIVVFGVMLFIFLVTSGIGQSVLAVTCQGNFTQSAGVCFPGGTGLSEKPVVDIVKNVMNWLLAIFGFIAIIGFAISGIQYLTSAGDEKMIETAKRNMKWSIVGVVVALSGFVIIKAVDAALNANPNF